MPEGKLVATPTGPLLKDLVDEWKRSMTVTRSSATVRGYSKPIDDFLSYLKPFEVTEARALTRRHLEGWQVQLGLRQLRPGSKSMYMTALRVFLRWAEQRYHPFADPNLWLDVASVPYPDREVHPLSDDDFNKIVRHVQDLPRTGTNLRDRALFFTFIASGARVSDVLRLKRADVGSMTEPYQKKVGKAVVVPQSVKQLIKEYLDARDDDCPAMWVSLHFHKVHPLTDEGVLRLWMRIADRIGITHFNSQQLRHTAILKMVESDVSYIGIAQHIGNKRIEPFRKYGTYLAKRRQEAVDAMDQLISASIGKPNGSKS